MDAATAHKIACDALDEFYPYVYRWDRCGRKGQRCNVRVRGKMNNCEVVFVDGFTMITSRNAIRKAAH